MSALGGLGGLGLGDLQNLQKLGVSSTDPDLREDRHEVLPVSFELLHRVPDLTDADAAVRPGKANVVVASVSRPVPALLKSPDGLVVLLLGHGVRGKSHKNAHSDAPLQLGQPNLTARARSAAGISNKERVSG